MDFELNKEQKDICKAAEAFAEGEFNPDIIEQLECDYAFPTEIHHKASELGFIGMSIPEKYGGQGLGLIENILVIENFCNRDSGVGLALALSDMGSGLILRYGTKEQKEKYLPAISNGEAIPSIAFLEEQESPEFPCRKTIAAEKDAHYIINGNKIFIHNLNIPGPLILFSRMENQDGSNKKAAFILDKGSPGLIPTLFEDRIGMRMVSIGNLEIADCLFPKDYLLGGEINGQSQLSFFLDEANIKASAISNGIGRGALNKALAYAHSRRQFGREIASFEAVRNRLTDMAARVELSRLISYKAAWDFAKKGSGSQQAAMAKKVAVETGMEVAKDAIHIFGGYGYIVDYQIERLYRDSAMVDIIGMPGYLNDLNLSLHTVGKTI